MADAQHLDDGVEIDATLRRRQPVHAEGQVGPHRQMRKQPPILEHIAQPTMFGGDVEAQGRVEQHLAVDDDAARIGPGQSGHHVDDRGLARPRRPEQGGDPRPRLQRHLNLEGALPPMNAQVQHGLQPFSRACTRRDRISAASSAVKATTTEMTHSRMAASSPPGTWVRA